VRGEIAASSGIHVECPRFDVDKNQRTYHFEPAESRILAHSFALTIQTDKKRRKKFNKPREINRLRMAVLAQSNVYLGCRHSPARIMRALILRLDNGLSISVLLCRSVRLRTGEMGWKIYPTPTERDYITLVCCLTERNDSILDFHLFPYIVKRSWYKFSDKNIWFRTGRKLQLEDLCREAKSLSRLDDASSNVMPC